MKVEIFAVAYIHAVYGRFTMWLNPGEVNVVRSYDVPGRRGVVTERLPLSKSRREAHDAIRTRIAELDQAAADVAANKANPEPLCSGEGKVSCA